MKAFSILFIFLFSLFGFSQEKIKNQTTTYFFIRHAEKDITDPKKRDPELTEEGKLRAQKWSKILADIKIDLVFSTDYSRTQNTAKPIAESQNLEILSYDPRDLNNKEFQKKTYGKTSVIVGHSNTTPFFVNKIVKKEKYTVIDEEEYGKLFIVTIKNGIITDVVLSID
ncbi:phosphoglycerate mutase family protein [Aquimarina gracilis]|uniref:Phosphoglycerate mutase family protein n=1 Tax=Aquimarina gracilis TaxID=874422 RepID=A0ABU5ZU23_9FLAO|nr:phosphoglycerate mutase family protein [Aquimarina gracilis]MEB3345581.1 phosphoglycerate mutase family protein [Aquimarina gracilis]